MYLASSAKGSALHCRTGSRLAMNFATRVSKPIVASLAVTSSLLCGIATSNSMREYLKTPRFPRMPISLKPPAALTSFLAQLPLIELPPEDSPNAAELPTKPVIWMEPSNEKIGGDYPWASSDPSCLRIQLLFLLRSVPVSFRPWSNPTAAPEGTLPALHLPSNELKSTGEIRTWLDTNHPLQGPTAQYHGVPDEAEYNRGIGLGALVMQKLLPAYLDALPSPPSWLPALFSQPPPLAAGLTSLIPASWTGDARVINHAQVAEDAIKAMRALQKVTEGGWAVEAENPTPLDALLASHLYVLYQLDNDKALRRAWESPDFDSLRTYVKRVMDYGSNNL